ncbi:MAG TPA: ribonuclease activity regulator RraA [Arsenicitalea sp.]|jgi:regulator of RNase E activity RraA|nr:ribonuclease activity regulator RraA [Arsenicitalea sp.]
MTMQDQDFDAATLEVLAQVSTNTIAGMLIKIGGMRTRSIRHARPLNPKNARFVGPAFTVRNVPVREDLTDRASMVSPKSHLHGTIDTIPAGSVVVFDMLGDTGCGAIGDVLVAVLINRGVAGLVTDGAMRDGDAISAMSLPVFSNGVAPAPSNRSLLAADVQVTIGCGGVMIVPGDIVVADPDGVVVVPKHLVAQVARDGFEQEQLEAWVKAKIENGAPATGLYPPDDNTKAAFYAWREQQNAAKPAAKSSAKS